MAEKSRGYALTLLFLSGLLLLGLAAKKSQCLEIPSHKGTLSKEEIEMLTKLVEEMAEEDKRVREERIEAWNKLESYVYKMKSAIDDGDGVGWKIDSEYKKRMNRVLKEALEWIDDDLNG